MAENISGSELLMEVPKEKPVILLILLSIITLLFYPFFWYLERSFELDNLGTKSKLKRAFHVMLILTFIVILGFISGGLIYMLVKDNLPTQITNFAEFPFQIKIILYAVAVFLGINILLQIISAFKVRKVLNEVMINKEENIKVSLFFTLIFGFLYLQYEINRIIKDREETKRKAPWIMFILLLVSIAVISFIIFYMNYQIVS